MIVTRTPFRASFVGGGSDVRWFYREHGYGAVLSAALASYMYIVIHPYFHEKRIRLKYSETEDITSVDQIRHNILRACLERFKLSGGIEIASFADVPAGTGLGSSSAFTVGLVNALHAWLGRKVSKHQLAEEACEIEIDVLGKPIGKQDQYASAFGGMQVYRFDRDETVSVRPVAISSESRRALESCCRLYYVTGDREAQTILAVQNSELDRPRKLTQIAQLVDLVEPMRQSIESGLIDEVGQGLHKAWAIKKQVSVGITTDSIDDYYERALAVGALGGKLLGAGGTGFLLLYADDHDKVQKSLGLRSLPFTVDADGSKVIFFEPPPDGKNG